MADLNNISIRLKLKVNKKKNFVANNLCANTHDTFIKTMCIGPQRKPQTLQKAKIIQIILQHNLKIHKTKKWTVPPSPSSQEPIPRKMQTLKKTPR